MTWLIRTNQASLSKEKIKVLLILRFVTVVDWWVTQCRHTSVYRRELQGSRATVQLMWKPCLPLPVHKKCKGKVRKYHASYLPFLRKGINTQPSLKKLSPSSHFSSADGK